ncbi:MAG: glycosyltransferase family 9 protein [Ignavibacteria bacterium]|nr:glycosyltransferase family 9 protein [Ignavibacteria bacterium]
MNITQNEIKKILIFKLCCFGDIIFLTPTISALKKNFPDAEISLIASPWIAALKNHLKYVEDVIIFNDVFEKNFFKKAIGTLSLIRVLRKKKFDLVFMGHRKSIFGLIVKLSGIKYRLGFRETKFLNLTEKFDSNIHETKRYINILKANGLSTGDKQMHLLQRKNKNEIKDSNNIERGKFIIGIFPFGGINPGTEMDIKRWDIENYYSLINKLTKDSKDYLILLFEGKHVCEKLTKKDFAGNVMVKSIDIDLISICDILVCGDTGPLYIADALEVSTIALFGPSDPRLVAPLDYPERRNLHQYIWKKPDCSPCYTPTTSIDKSNKKYWKGNRFLCNTGTHECMKEIMVDEVFLQLNEMIKKIKKSHE